MKQISILISIAFIISGIFNPGQVFAQQAQMPGFDANKLIDDGVFRNTNSFSGPEAIQKFLADKNSVLADTSAAFIAKLGEPTSSSLKDTVEDPGKNKSGRTAAEIIYDASKSAGINPQVILVTLNKEQSLINGRQNSTPEQLQRALDFAMGFGCPDTQPCGAIYKGFYFQLFGNVDAENNRYLGAARSLMKSFTTPGGRGPFFNGATSKVGDTITLDNTLGGYEGVKASQSVKLSNAATAALYRYTPHVYNGNYNFWRFFTTWFGASSITYPDGTLIRQSGKSEIWYMQSGKRMKVLEFVAQARNFRVEMANTVPKSAFREIADGGLLGMQDGVIIKVDDKYFVFVNNIKRPATEFIITQRGQNTNTAITVSKRDAGNFETGPALTPNDGTIVKGQTGTTYYLVLNGELKSFTPGTLAQYDAVKKAQIMPDAELEAMPKKGEVPPKDGSLIKGSGPSVYIMEAGMKKPLTYEIFIARGWSFASIITIPDSELASYPEGAMPLPANMTFFTNTANGEFWVYMNGGKHKISSFVATQKGLTPDYKFTSAYVESMPMSTPIIPKDGTAIKSDKTADVYLVEASVLKPMTWQAFLNRKLTPKNVIVLPQAEVDSYVKGALITK